ncbi:heavy metal translocating P-type ATPase [Corynebacterium tapiri]|uniref:HAD family hydrolase n=1 Tax=Corynebacterium tapiri TaxID=1448266 RepID=A0A5C4U3F6_9CORY|nr:HAD family hydrolase [Corynebacterium tapiri]TNL97296.1 HAD family hydrolase [Corynebacterium tapiri]
MSSPFHSEISDLADSVDPVVNADRAINEAWSAARSVGLSPGGEEARGEDGANVSYAFDITGLRSAPDCADIEAALEDVPGVRARLIYSSSTAWITAPETVKPAQLAEIIESFGVQATLTDSSLRRRTLAARRGPSGASKKMHKVPWATRRHHEEEKRALERAQAAGFFGEDSHAVLAESNHDRDVLYTARELISLPRLILAAALTLPVVVMFSVSSAQFSGWQWLSLALATPVVTWCAWPFHRALAGGIRRGLTALDGASALAVIVAYLWSFAVMLFTRAGDLGWHTQPTWFSFDHGPIADGALFLDVACVMTTLLLAGRLATTRHRGSLLREMELRRPDPHAEVLTVGQRGHKGATSKEPREPRPVALGEVNVGDDIIILAGELIPVDGQVVGGSCHLSPGLVAAGIEHGTEVKVGSYVYAGTRNLDGRIKVRVERTGHRTRLASVHAWVTEANRRQNHATMLSTKAASVLIPAAIGVAVIDFALWYLVSQNLNIAIATAIAVLASIAPVALALSPTLAIRHGVEAAARHGVLFRDGATVRQIDAVDTVIFNRLGTLTTNAMTLENVVAERGENPEVILRVAAALMMESDHPASQAIVKAARASRDRDHTTVSEVPHWIDVSRLRITEEGSFVGIIELNRKDGNGTRQVEAELWRPRTMSNLSGRLAAAVVSGGTPLIVRWQGVDRGVITLLDSVREDASEGVESLEEHGIETVMLSRDAYPVSRRLADRIGIDKVLAGIAPGDKLKAVRGVHTRGGTVALVGDQTVMHAMPAADVGILAGSTQALEAAAHGDRTGVGVVVLDESVGTIAKLVAHSRRVCRIIDRNFLISWTYNVVAVLLAVAGVLNPMGATVLMLCSSLLVEARSNSAGYFPR